MQFPGKDKKPSLLCALAVMLVVVCASSILPAQEQWAVLQNGQTLQGKVSIADGRYTIVMPNGSRIIIAEAQINFVADSINEIYWEKWSRVDPTDASSHIHLFRWCLKHDLLDEAQKQIDLVTKISDMKDQAETLSRMAQELEMVVARIEKNAQLAAQSELKKLDIRNLPNLPAKNDHAFASAPNHSIGSDRCRGPPRSQAATQQWITQQI